MEEEGKLVKEEGKPLEEERKPLEEERKLVEEEGKPLEAGSRDMWRQQWHRRKRRRDMRSGGPHRRMTAA